MKKLSTLLTIGYFAILLSVGAVAYGEIAKRALTNELAYSVHDKNVYLSDFVQFWTCGKMVLGPERSLVYDAAAINRSMPVSLPNDDRILLAMPYFIIFMAPWSFLPVHPAFLVWIALSLAALVGGSLLILKSMRSADLPTVAGFVAAILVAQPAWFTLFIGHACFFQYLFIALFFWGLYRGRGKDLTAAAAMALTSFKPQFALPLVVPALAQKRYKLLGLAMAFEALLVLMSILVLGPETTFGGPLAVARWEHLHTNIIPRMISLRAVLDTVLPHAITQGLAWCLYGLALLLNFLVWRRVSTRPELFGVASAFTVTTGVLFSPHAHIYDAMLMGLAACFLLPTSGFAAFFGAATRVEKLLWLSFLLYPLLSWYFFTGVSVGGNLVGYPFAALDLLILILIALLFREKAAAQTGEDPSIMFG